MDADLVCDVRFLPNPHWIPELRPHTGLEEAVRGTTFLSRDGAEEYLDTFRRLLELTTAGYRREGKRYMTIAVGCTGGKHRSVAMSEALAARLGTEDGLAVRVVTAMWSRMTDASTTTDSRAPRIVAFGGGHGLYATLSAARRLSSDVTAVVTVADDGGSSGRLRNELGMIARRSADGARGARRADP